MMLFNLSVKNIKRSLRDYTIYFFTLVLGVSIFYTFNSIESQQVMIDMTESTSATINVIVNVLSGISVFISFILGFLIIYASRFLIKRRSKEFGIYMILGMEKKNVSKILVLENILIGLISLIIGLVIGVILSQVMSILVSNMFDGDMTRFKFTFSSKALLKTMVYFGIMYLLVIIFSAIQVNKYSLVDLLSRKNKSESIKFKNQYICLIIFVVGVALLSYAYYNVTLGSKSLENITSVFTQILCGIVATFLIMWSSSGLLLKVIMSRKQIYFKNINSFILKQISSKINTTVASMSIICLMLFLTISIFTSAISVNLNINSSLSKLAPIDITIQKIIEHSDLNNGETIQEKIKNTGFKLDENLEDIIEVSSYASEDLTLNDTLGEQLKSIENQDTSTSFNIPETIFKISDYNKIAKLYGLETHSLNDNEYIIVANYENMIKIRNKSLEDNTKITLNGIIYTPKYERCQNGLISISNIKTNMGFIVLPDSAVSSDFQENNKYLVANYNATNKKGKYNIERSILELEGQLNLIDENLSINTKIAIYDDNIGTSALAVFIGMYIGIIFLISSACILALKELSDYADNKEIYTILKKIGVDEKEINKAIFIQIAFIFCYPLFLAIIHSIFGLQAANSMLESYGNIDILSSFIMTTLLFCVIYGGYFVITYLSSINIIKNS